VAIKLQNALMAIAGSSTISSSIKHAKTVKKLESVKIIKGYIKNRGGVERNGDLVKQSHAMY